MKRAAGSTPSSVPLDRPTNTSAGVASESERKRRRVHLPRPIQCHCSRATAGPVGLSFAVVGDTNCPTAEPSLTYEGIQKTGKQGHQGSGSPRSAFRDFL